MYTWHAGHVAKGQTVPPPPRGYNSATATQDAKDVWDTGDTKNYISPAGDTTRMALPANAKVTTQTQVQNDIKALDKQIDTWAATERAKIAAKTVAPTTGLLSEEYKILQEHKQKYKKTMDDRIISRDDAHYPLNRYSKSDRVRFSLKGGKGQPDLELPPEYEYFSGTSKYDRNLVTPLRNYGQLGKAAAQKQAYEDYVKIQAARKVIEQQDDLDFKNVKCSLSGKITIPNKKGGQDLDTGMYVTQNYSTGKWEVSISMYGHTHPALNVKFSSQTEAANAVANHALNNRAVEEITNNRPAASLGQTNTDLVEFDAKVKTLKDVLYGDSFYNGKYGGVASGRYGIIKGYDGVMLNQSYASERMFVVYNRSKVLVDQNSFDYSTGQQRGAAV